MDRIVVCTCCFVILGSSLWLWADYGARLSAGDGEQIGTITFRRRSAMRKYGNQVIWESVEQDSPVYSMDSLKTEEDSAALIRLANGIEIELEENSLVLLDWNERETRIEFERGAIRTRGQGAPGDNLVVSLSNNRLSARGADLTLRRAADAAVTVTLVAGQASISGEGLTTALSTNLTARLAPAGGVPVLEPRLIRHLAPADGSRFLSSGAPVPVAFSWRTENTDAREGVLELDAGAAFPSPRTIPAARAGTVDLPPGTWYWRIRMTDGAGGTVTSLPARIEVLAEPPARTLAPAPDAVIPYRGTLPAVTFRWSTGPLAASARIQLSRSEDFSRIDRETRATGNEMTIDLPEAGDWFWRIVPVYGFGDTGTSGASRPARLRITRRAELPAPVPQAPAANRTVSTLEIARRGLAFSYTADDGILAGEVEIAATPAFDAPVRRMNASGGFVILRDPLAPGTWYWRARRSDGDGSHSPFSPVRRLHVIALAADSLRPLAPADAAELDDANIVFRWESPDLPGSYRLQLAATADFENPEHETSLAARSLRQEGLAPGKWFWRVQLVDENNEALATSTVRSFRLLSRLAAPRLLVPRQGAVIDMRRADALVFSWEEVPQASRYRLRLLDGAGAVLADAEAPKPPWRFTDLQKLDVGGFRWELTALPAGNAFRPGPPATAAFTITLGPPPEAPHLLSPEVQYVE